MRVSEQAANVIRWVDRLLVTRAKQGHYIMGNKKRGRCCLAIGCDELGVSYDSDDVSNAKLAEITGLISQWGDTNGGYLPSLIYLNDQEDLTFREIGKNIIKTAHLRFRPGVAKIVQKHYGGDEK